MAEVIKRSFYVALTDLLLRWDLLLFAEPVWFSVGFSGVIWGWGQMVMTLGSWFGDESSRIEDTAENTEAVRLLRCLRTGSEALRQLWCFVFFKALRTGAAGSAYLFVMLSCLYFPTCHRFADNTLKSTRGGWERAFHAFIGGLLFVNSVLEWRRGLWLDLFCSHCRSLTPHRWKPNIFKCVWMGVGCPTLQMPSAQKPDFTIG